MMGPQSFQRSIAARVDSEQTSKEVKYRRLTEALTVANKSVKRIKWRSGEQVCIPAEMWKSLLLTIGMKE